MKQGKTDYRQVLVYGKKCGHEIYSRTARMQEIMAGGEVFLKCHTCNDSVLVVATREGEQRTCTIEGCDRKLSRYNPHKTCWIHIQEEQMDRAKSLATVNEKRPKRHRIYDVLAAADHPLNAQEIEAKTGIHLSQVYKDLSSILALPKTIVSKRQNPQGQMVYWLSGEWEVGQKGL